MTIYDDKAYSTAHLKGDDKVFCAYCGKEIQPEIEWDEYDKYEFYHCNCEDAAKEYELILKIRGLEEKLFEIRRQFPKRKYELKKTYIAKRKDE